MHAFAAVLALATSALALSVTQPTNTTGFSNNGQNTVSWTRVNTDPANFTIVLVNKNVFPNYQQVLDALVDGGSDSGTVQVGPPSAGWPTGSGYQINLATSAERLDSLLAQSDDFSFHAPDSSSVSGSSASATGSVSRTVLSVSNTAAPTGSGSGAGAGGSPSGGADGSQPSDGSPTPTGSSSGAATIGVQAAFFGAVALVGAVLA
jgi:hypothetical protein